MIPKFDKRMQNLPENIYHLIDKIVLLKSKWVAGAKLDPQVLGKLKKSVLITSTGASTRIEGSDLSDADVEILDLSLNNPFCCNLSRRWK